MTGRPIRGMGYVTPASSSNEKAIRAERAVIHRKSVVHRYKSVRDNSQLQHESCGHNGLSARIYLFLFA
jgi:hypothetical protein